MGRLPPPPPSPAGREEAGEEEEVGEEEAALRVLSRREVLGAEDFQAHPAEAEVEEEERWFSDLPRAREEA